MANFSNLSGTTISTFKIGKGGSTFHPTGTQPSVAENGDFWFDTTEGQLYTRISGSWQLVKFDNISITGNTIASLDANGDIIIDPNGTGNIVIGNYTLDGDQSVGAGQDGYVLTYNNSTGEVSLEDPTVSISLTGDVTGTGTDSIAATIANNVVTNAKLADMAGHSVKVRVGSGSGDPSDLVLSTNTLVGRLTGNVTDLTGTQVTGILDVFTDSLKGLAPASGGGTANFLRADGTWTAPPVVGGGISAKWEYKDPTGASDPGSGNFRTNSGLIANVTAIYIADETKPGVDLALILGALANGDVIFCQNIEDSAEAALFTINGSITDNAGWFNIPVTFEDRSTSTTFTDGKEFGFVFSRQSNDEITLTGDVTGSGTGSFATTISNNVVSNAKLRDSAGLSVIGRGANSSGDPADIVAGTDGHVLRRSGTTLDFGQIATGGISDEAVTLAKIQHIATDSFLGRDTAGTGDVETLSASTAKGILNITAADISDVETSASDRARANHTGTQLMSTISDAGDLATLNTVGTTEIDNNAVTFDKLEDVAEDRILGRVSTGAGNAEELTAAQVRTLLNVADGAQPGTVTSVAISGTDGIQIDSGSPITTSGTITLGLNYTTLEGNLNHDNLVGFVGNEHIDWTNATQNLDTAGNVSAGNITLSANTISSTNTDGDINITPDGTGEVVIGNASATSTLTAPDNADAIIEAGAATTGLPGADLFLRGGDGTAGTGVDGNVIIDQGNLNLSSNNIINGGTITATSFVGDLTGNADTATTWETGRTISLTGNVTGTSGTFDGSGNASITATIADEAVTLAKIQHIATDRLLGRTTAGTGDVEILTAAQVRTILNVADGAQPGTVTAVTAGTGLDSSGGTAPNITLDLAELPDGTGGINGPQDEIIYLDNGVQRRKQVNEWALGQFNNDQGWTSNSGTVTSVAISGTDGIEVDSGSPITGAGTITLGLNSSTLESNLNHDNLAGFVGNEHIDWTGASQNFSTTGYIRTTNSYMQVSRTGDAADAWLYLDGDAGEQRGIQFRTGTVARWQIRGANSTAEGGSDTGSDFQITGYDDSVVGTTGFFIKRSTGNVGMGNITNPLSKLSVGGDIRVQASNTPSTSDMILKGAATPAISVGGSTTAGVITTAGTSGSSGHVGIEISSNDANDGFYIATDANQDGTVDTLAVKINADGEMGILGQPVTGRALNVEGDTVVDGNVGIGINSPGTQLHVEDGDSGGSINGSAQLALESSGTACLQFSSPNTSINIIRFGDNFNNTAGSIEYQHNGDTMVFEVGSSNVVEIDDTGQIDLVGSSPGISWGNEFLDDYDEGTWTPVLWDASNNSSEGQTYSRQSGRYTRIGNMCYFYGRITVSSLGTLTTSDVARIGGLPFTSEDNQQQACYVGFGGNLNLSSNRAMSGYVQNNQTYIALTMWDDLGGTTNLTISEYGANGGIMFAGSYRVA